MAYQPFTGFPGPIAGHLSEISTSDISVGLATAGIFYLVLCVRIRMPAPINEYAIPLEAISVLAGKKSLEWKVLLGATFGGDALSFSQLDPLSVLEGAQGNGTQEVLDEGVSLATGRYVPKDEERGLPRETLSTATVVPVPVNVAACLVATPLGNNSSVYARAEFLEIELDSEGDPADRGVPLGM